MGTWKLIVYPFGMAIAGMALVDLIGIALFGVNGCAWLDWQNQGISAFGTAAGIAGMITGVYLAVRAHAHLVPR